MSDPAASCGPAVSLKVDGDVLWATVDRPTSRNAIDLEVLVGLERMLDRIYAVNLSCATS